MDADPVPRLKRERKQKKKAAPAKERMNDSRPVKHDFIGIVTDWLYDVNGMVAFFLFVAFILVNSDVFITRILSKFSGAVDYKYPTSWGVLIQAMFFVLFYIVVDLLAKKGVV